MVHEAEEAERHAPTVVVLHHEDGEARVVEWPNWGGLTNDQRTRCYAIDANVVLRYLSGELQE